MKRRSISSFTLIELLIVVSIVPMTSIAVYTLVARVHSEGDKLSKRSEAIESSESAIRLWREDVTLASRVEISGDGREMTITRPAASGTESEIRYAVSGASLQRNVQGGAIPVAMIVRGIDQVEFSRTGLGYGISSYQKSSRSTPRRQTWGFATPLAQRLPRTGVNP